MTGFTNLFSQSSFKENDSHFKLLVKAKLEYSHAET